VIHGGARTISIKAIGKGTYVRGLRVNGTSQDRTWLELSRSGRLGLQFLRALAPQRWGSGASDVPPSFANAR
jgi:putative alpha-1,2-mannosidase